MMVESGAPCGMGMLRVEGWGKYKVAVLCDMRNLHKLSVVRMGLYNGHCEFRMVYEVAYNVNWRLFMASMSHYHMI